MDGEKDSLIAQLRNELKARDSDIILAATYGKQLVEEKANLTSKVDELFAQNELLVQENHSLQLDLETKIQAVRSQTNDLELQRERADDLEEKIKVNEKGNETLHKKIECLTKENQYLKKLQDDINVETKSLKEKINIYQKQISNFEDQAEKSLCETYNDEHQELQAQLNVYILNNKELKDALSHSQCELELAKKNENHLLQMVHELEEAVSEKSTEITSCHEEIKKAKEEIEELQGEIEVLKFDQVDVNKRGNSVFAELDDRRTLVEKEYKILRKKYEQFHKDYEENKKELDRARGQMAILQSMVTREYQQTYIDKLEDSLLVARQEIHDLMYKLSRALKANAEKNTLEDSFSQRSEYDYLRVMLHISQKKERDLQNEVMNLKTKNMYDNDKLVKAQHFLHKGKEDLDSSRQEIFKLKQKVKELEQGIMRELPKEQVPQKPRIEILEGFKRESNTNEKTELLNKSLFSNAHDPDVIPAELELCEDGFREVRPRRKSNRFILREFNRIQEPDEECEKLPKPPVTSELPEVLSVDKRLESAEPAEKPKSVQKSRPKQANRRNENCAQQ